MSGTIVVLLVLALASGFGLYRKYSEGRVRSTEQSIDHGIGELGEKGTILQFSSAFCAPCRAAKVISGEVAAIVPGVKHIEIDAESNLDLVRTFNVMRTPTLFVLDKQGRVSARIAGVPRKNELLIALDDRAAENL